MCSWALKRKTGLTVIGGGHSGHCLWSNIVAVDMTAFDKVHICQSRSDEAVTSPDGHCTPLVVAEVGCRAGDIVRKTMSAGVTVPLGARPSTGAGLWLQGGIGHLTRLYGLVCNAVVGVVANEHCPVDAVRPENQTELLWAVRGVSSHLGTSAQ